MAGRRQWVALGFSMGCNFFLSGLVAHWVWALPYRCGSLGAFGWLLANQGLGLGLGIEFFEFVAFSLFLLFIVTSSMINENFLPCKKKHKQGNTLFFFFHLSCLIISELGEIH